MTAPARGSGGKQPGPAGVGSPSRAKVGVRTLRTDRWWAQPIGVAVILTVLLGYAIVRIFLGKYYWVDEYRYLTPLFSPCISESCVPGSSHFGAWLGEFPAALPLPIIVFPILLGFRGTCYYYRKATYRAFLASPPACAVAEPARKYSGESKFPLVLQNYHRYFFYLASILLLVNTYDAILAFFPKNGGFGIGLGTLVLLANLVMLWCYSLSCHACRHALGGRLKHFSRHPARYWMWTKLSRLNGKHMQFAWASLVSVMVTDLYILLVASGTISDLRIIN